MASLTSGNASLSVGQGIHLFRPTEPDAIDPSHPTVILIFGWMAAKLSHLLKYTSIYRERYPNTTLVLTQCEPSFFWSSEHGQRKSLTPLVEILEAIGLIHPLQQPSEGHKLRPLGSVVSLPVHRVLVHAFSNGGCCQLMTLNNIISNHHTSLPTMPTYSTSALILDSCPGDESFSSAERAFTVSVSNPALRMLAKLSVMVLFTFRLVMKLIFRQKSIISSMRSWLNNPDLLPWVKKNSPRLYIYSEGDEMVLAEAVERHMSDALGKGLNVHSVKFGKESKHVAHARTDPSRYWGTTEQMWKAAIEAQD